MRLNKYAIAFIKKQIDAKASAKIKQLAEERNRLFALESKYIDEHKDEYDKQISSLVEKYEAEVMKVMDRFRVKYGGEYYDRVTVSIRGAEFSRCTMYGERIEAIKTEIDSIRDKANSSLEEIVARVSIGGDSKMLDEMISKLEF